MIRFCISACLALLISNSAVGQNGKELKLIQFSGLVVTSDSLMGIPYATVLIKGSGRGTISDYQGFFSLVAALGDTVIFSAIGFKRNDYVIPDTLKESKYSIIELLSRDTIYLPETVIYPFPTKEQFRQAFLNLNIPDDDLERARKNLEQQRLQDIAATLNMDANENVDYFLRKEAQKYYYAGAVPPMNIFSPLAWSQFIEAWKRGDFKKK